MKKTYLFLTVFLLLPLFMTADARADQPYQISLIYPFQIVDRTEAITGFRFNFVYGINDDITGLDVGGFNRIDGVQKGLQLGFLNKSFKTKGLQIGLFNYTEYLEGIQIGILNIHNEGDMRIMPGINFKF